MGNFEVAVIGCGVIGLPTALLLARAGQKVTGVDISRGVVDEINSWCIPILEMEAGLKQVADDPVTRENLKAQTECPQADVFLIAVPTPLDERRKICDMGAVESAVNGLLPKLKSGNLIILESTVPPKTCTEFVAPKIRACGFEPGKDIHLAFCPERVLPGDAYKELVNNDRVIGGFTPECAIKACEVYKTFVKGELKVTDATTAELCKLTENAYRDVCVAFANEIALTADGLGINRNELIELANRHPRVDILKPGIGVGGHCLPIDPYFIVEADPFNTRMIRTARRVNDDMPLATLRKIHAEFSDLKNPRILGIGVTYKPDTPDTRESPALRVWDLVREAGYELKVYDPLIEEYKKDRLNELIQWADGIVVLVSHKHAIQDLNDNQELIIEKCIPVLRLG